MFNTTISFAVPRLRCVCAENWNALRAVGESANRRLCDAVELLAAARQKAEAAQEALDALT